MTGRWIGSLFLIAMVTSLLGGGLIESIVSSTSPDNFTAIFENQTRLTHIIDIDDQVEACRRIFVSDTRWTVVRGSDLEEGESQGLPAWSRHVGDPILASNITRRVDYALFMMEALKNDELIHEAPAIVGCQTPSALAHKVQK
jgi:hypothetical protein